MDWQQSNLNAAIILMLATSVAAGGFGQTRCAANLCVDSSAGASTSGCCGPQCRCSGAVSEVRACCCTKPDKDPAQLPATTSSKVSTDLSWIPWAYLPAGAVAIAALAHAEESVSSSSPIVRSVQSVLCIWRI
jgi:hypothetical protein